MNTHDPIILEYREPSDPHGGGDSEYGFIREVFGWFFVAFLVIGTLIATIAAMSALAWAIR